MYSRINMLLLVSLFVVIALPVLAADAGSAKLVTVSWSNVRIADALVSLHKSHGMNYVLPTAYSDRNLTVNLWQVNIDKAIQTIAAKAGLKATLTDGTWAFTEITQDAKSISFAQFGAPGGGRMIGGPGGMPGVGAAPGMVGDLGNLGMGGGFGTPPGRGQVGQQNMLGQQNAVLGERPRTFVVIPIFRASPSVLGQALNVDFEIWDDFGSSGGSNDNYGSDSSSDYGSSSSSDRGSSRSSDRGSSRSSDRGSSRSSNRSSNRSY